jgi:hypothetical protein
VISPQPRPQGLPRGGARAEEDPGKINTAEKRLRMRGNKKDGEEFKCKIINKNMAI